MSRYHHRNMALLVTHPAAAKKGARSSQLDTSPDNKEKRGPKSEKKRCITIQKKRAGQSPPRAACAAAGWPCGTGRNGTRMQIKRANQRRDPEEGRRDEPKRGAGGTRIHAASLPSHRSIRSLSPPARVAWRWGRSFFPPFKCFGTPYSMRCIPSKQAACAYLCKSGRAGGFPVVCITTTPSVACG